MVSPPILIKELRRSGSAKIKLDFAKSNTESTECYTKVSAYEERDEDYSHIRISI